MPGRQGAAKTIVLLISSIAVVLVSVLFGTRHYDRAVAHSHLACFLAKMKDPDPVIRLQESTIGQHLLPCFGQPLMDEQYDINYWFLSRFGQSYRSVISQ